MSTVPETSIVFRRSGGHSHDGVTSSLIDVKKYSLFDFIPALSATSDTARGRYQSSNQSLIKKFIIDTVEERVLNPQGIQIRANSISAREIVSGTITAGELSANLILVNNVIQSNNFSLANNTGWSISYSGDAYFGNAILRGTIIATDGFIGGWNIDANRITAGNTLLHANGYIIVDDGVFNGAIYADEGIFSGSIYSGVGAIGGWVISSSYIASGTNDTVLYSNGTITGAELVGGSLIVGTYAGNPGDIGINIAGGYIRGGGGGVRFMSWTGATGVSIDGNKIDTPIFSANTSSGIYTITNSRVEMTVFSNSTSAQPIDISRGYNSGANFIRFINYDSSSAVGAIEFNTSSTARYATSSDSRLKTNIKNINNAIVTIKKITPVEFEWVESGGTSDHGFIAQDLYQVYPQPVSVGKEDVKEKPWMIDYGQLTPIITAALKEVIEKVEILESRLNTIDEV